MLIPDDIHNIQCNKYGLCESRCLKLVTTLLVMQTVSFSLRAVPIGKIVQSI